MVVNFIIVATVLLIAIIGFVFNTLNLFKKKAIYENIAFISLCIFNLLSIIYISMMKEYDVPALIYGLGGSPAEYHTPISEKYISVVMLVILVYLFSLYLFLKMKNKIPPLIKAAGLSGILCGIILNIVIMIQLYKNINAPIDKTIYYLFLPIIFNFLFSINMIKKMIILEKSESKEMENSNGFIKFIYKNMDIGLKWYFLIVAFLLPLIIVMLIVTVLLGEKPDAVIKAFTETSDWTFSQKISPPPIEYEGHYLCTVAANGHNKIVKPIRIGIRQNTKIIVNRQLCVANAFEQLIMEKFPRMHKVIRSNYDKYGYPLSKHINTKLQADIVYIVMKPLELGFLMVLYTFDTKPENRIAMQYIKEESKDQVIV